MNTESILDRSIKFVFLRAGSKSADFRFSLAEELARIGYEVVYIYLSRRPEIVFVGNNSSRRLRFYEFILYLFRNHFRNGTIFFNSTNLAFYKFSIFLRRVFSGIWVFDLHDDLAYNLKGYQFKLARERQNNIALASDVVICASPESLELCAGSVVLGNASDSEFHERSLFENRVLIIASFDNRFDFDLFDRICDSCTNIVFNLYGHVSGGDVYIERKLRKIIDSYENVIYHGPYSSSDIDNILSNYSITFAPYITNSDLTKYIDPLRFYHCLNSGMELITTDFEASRRFSRFVHIIDGPDEFANIVNSLIKGDSKQKLNNIMQGPMPNWRDRALQFLKILRSKLGSD